VAFNLDPQSQETQKLAEYYYKVRAGIGFNKTPEVYGAFPTDPYSHTPKQAGAQQPGMTGQVKEEILTRFGELGLLVEDAKITFKPSLLKEREFLIKADQFTFINLDSKDQIIELSSGQLGFTYCQVPFVYSVSDVAKVEVMMANEEVICSEALVLNDKLSHSIFSRDGAVKQVTVSLPASLLLKEG
jgi:hypothetical protein